MGGFGSGQRWSKKDVVEGRHAIDTASLKRWNLLVPGTTGRPGAFEWRRGGEGTASSSVSYFLTVGPTEGTLRLLYTIKSLTAELDYPVRLVTTPCHLGGVRWWFVCPLVRGNIPCGRRVRRLYLSGRYFGCRHCHGLTYTSSQGSDCRVYAALRGGLDFGRFRDVRRMSVAQLGFALKVLTFEQRRLDRVDRRLDRAAGRRRSKAVNTAHRDDIPSDSTDTDP
ncbi:MAG: hypothetical protein K2X87_12885 [Gemmataceae bacterium]|nr:hypothetical protein [Gemmataceae bacterium]